MEIIDPYVINRRTRCGRVGHWDAAGLRALAEAEAHRIAEIEKHTLYGFEQLAGWYITNGRSVHEFVAEQTRRYVEVQRALATKKANAEGEE